MDNLLIIALLFFIELAETSQYKGSTFNDVIKSLHLLYKRNIFQFILFNSSLFYVIYISFEHTIFNIWSLTIILMKLSDLAVKIYLFKIIEKEGELNIGGFKMDSIQIDWKMKYFSVPFYTGLLILAIL